MRASLAHRLLACALGAASAAGAGRLSAADCNGNGTEDAADIAAGASEDCNRNGTPDECDIAPGRFGFSVTGSPSPDSPGSDGILNDADADGDLDLLVVTATPAEVRLQPNLGGIGFGDAQAVSLGDPARSAVLADLDADGDVDAAFAGAFGVTVFLKSPAGFEKAGTLPIGSDPVRIAAMHLDGDSLPEIVTVNSIGAEEAVNISVLRNTGNGTFSAPRNYGAGASPIALLRADVNGDGDPDIVLVHSDGERMTVLENDSSGIFSRRVPIELGPTERPHGVIAGRLDDNPTEDLVIAYPFQKVEVIFNPISNPQVDAVRRSVVIDAGMEAGEGLVQDLDGDGAGDILLAGKFSSKLWVFLGRGRGVFKQDLPTDFPRPPFAVRSGDLDGDGDIDLVLAARGLTWIALQELAAASGDGNSNGIPDECEGTLFVRGDSDADGMVGLSDAVVTLSSLFQGGEAVPCDDALDANDDGRIDLTDALAVLLHLFQGGPSPREPFPACGIDLTGDALDCGSFDACP
jgi:hypothetical protein